MKEYETLYLVVNNGDAKKINKKAKRFGIYKTTTLLGRGTIKHKLLEFFELNSYGKEIVVLTEEKELVRKFCEKINKEFNMKKKNKGISFLIPVKKIISTSINNSLKINKEDIMYNVIFVIVEKGTGELVVDAASKVGSNGATIINARGSSYKETQKIFNIDIEPEKEIVFILAKKELVDSICESIKVDINIEEPGKGIMFVQEVSKVYGLR